MATAAPSMGAPACASTINRRHLFAGMASATAIAAVPAMATVDTTPSDAAWQCARKIYERANAMAESYYESTYSFHLDRTSREIDDCPPQYFEYIAKDGTVGRWPLDMEGAKGRWFSPMFNRLHDEAVQRIVDWRDRSAKIDCEPLWASIMRQMDMLWDEEDAARSAMMAHPAPNGEALAFKVALALEQDEIWANEREAILADAKRLRVASLRQLT